MAPDGSAGLLAPGSRRPFGGMSVVRVTSGGRATRRETLFEPGLLARLWRGPAGWLPPMLLPVVQPAAKRTGRTSG